MSYQQTADFPINYTANPMIIGISGTNGSGKDTIGILLQEKYGFMFKPFTELLREEARRLNKPVERHVLREVSASWRKRYGLGVLVDKSLDKYFELNDKNQFHGLAVASLRNPGEADRVHELGGIVIWADADPEIRYQRIQNNTRDGRAHEDNKTFKEFMEEEEAEMRPSDDDLESLNMYAVKTKADLTIINNGENIDGFKTDIGITLENKLKLKPIK